MTIPAAMSRWIALMLALLTNAALAEQLTIERLYEDPALSGSAPRNLKLSPDGQRVSFLRGSEKDQNTLDLWEYHVPSKATRLLVAAQDLTGGNEQLSDEEKARRERQRLAGLSGIIEYQWSDDGKQLMFPLNGAIYVYRLDAKDAADKVRQLTRAEDGFATDPKFSPKGGYISFVRDQDLYVVDLKDGSTRALTSDGAGTISNGMAEFVAQEEMNRDTGYWWAPDDSAIAYARIDEAPVPIERRFEIYADRTAVIEQRYPAAGKANVLIDIYVRGLAADAKPVKMDLGAERDIYVARVDWLPDAKAVAIQRQSRDQRRLDLLIADRQDGRAQSILTETSQTWINLHHNLRFLPKGEGFVWSSEASGHRHLALHAMDGKKIRDLTQGPWVVDQLLALDVRKRLVYFAANAGDVREKHVFVQSLDTRNPGSVRRLSALQGWHEAVFSKDASVYVNTWSDEMTPPQVRLHRADGSEIAVLEANRVVEGHPYHPYLKSHQRPEYGTLEAADGQLLHYRVIKPKDFDPAKRHPVFLRVYGGPHVQYVQRRWDERWGLFDQVMAQRGYVVYSLDNRGSDRRGVAFESPIHRNMGGPEVEDQMVGVRWLKEQPWVDPQRIGVFGWSYGGYMTLMMLAKHSAELAAGVSVAPVSEWRLYDTHYTERYMDHPAQYAAAYDQAALFAHIDGLKSPLFLIHGMADDNVLFTHSTQVMQALQERGVQFDLMTYPGGKHGLAGNATRKHVFNAIAGYFDRQLKGDAAAR